MNPKEPKVRSLSEWDKIDRRTSTGIRHVGRSLADALPSGEEWQQIDVKPRSNKQPVYLRLDPDVLEWFRAQGKGYQTHINAVLRSYMLVQKGRS